MCAKPKAKKNYGSLENRVAELEAANEELRKQLNDVVIQHINTSLLTFQDRLDMAEKSIVRLIESQAVAFKLLFERTKITAIERQQLLRKLYAVKEFADLVRFLTTQRKFVKPISALKEITRIGYRDDIKDQDHQVIIELFPDKADEPILVHTIYHNKRHTTLEHGGPENPNAERTSKISVYNTTFVALMRGQDSPDRVFLEGLIDIENPYAFYEFLYSLDVLAYKNGTLGADYLRKEMTNIAFMRRLLPLQNTKAPATEVKQEADTPIIAKSTSPEVDPTTGHPANAIIFGGGDTPLTK